MKWKRVLLVSMMVISLSFSAEAANWTMVADLGNFNAFIDTTSISGSSEGPKEAWFKYEIKTTNSYFLNYGRFYKNKTYCIIDAYEDKVGEPRFTWFKGHSCSSPDKVIPDSVEEKFWNYLYQ